jgi:uncharacterized protein (DUF1778 family)
MTYTPAFENGIGTSMTTTAAESIASRDARLEARVSRTQKDLLRRAAALSGRTLSDFVVASAQEAAARIIQDHEALHLSQAEQTRFVKALLSAPPPGPRLRKAAAAYRKNRGL